MSQKAKGELKAERKNKVLPNGSTASGKRFFGTDGKLNDFL
jgi:hypothetical protein